MTSLKKGNLQEITLLEKGGETQGFVEANPQNRKINFYDSDIKLVPKEGLDQYKSVNLSPSSKLDEKPAPDKKKELKQEVKPEQSKPSTKKE